MTSAKTLKEAWTPQPSRVGPRKARVPAEPKPLPRQLPQPGDLLPVERVAAILAVTRKRIYALVDEGRLQAIRVGARNLRILRSSLEEYYREAVRQQEEGEP